MTVASLRSGSIDTRINNLHREATNLKTSQFTGWDSIKCYKIETTNTWDYQTTLTPGPFSSVYIQVRYRADKQDAPFGKLVSDVQLDGGYAYRTTPGVSNPYVFTGENHQREVFFSNDTVNPKELFWVVQINTTNITTVKVKLRVFATQPGRLTAGALINGATDGTIFIQ